MKDDGSVQNSAAYNVTGTVTGENVALSLNGGLATVARWLGGPTDFVGTLSGDSLTLSAGNQVEHFQEVSQGAYDSMLAALRQRGARIAASRSAFDAMARVQRDAAKLNDDLNRYVAWARQRIDRAAGLRNWYEVRLQNYNRCLSTITPLAAAHVPSWKWQSCVLAVDNDSYARDQTAQSVRDAQSKNIQAIADLNQRIAAINAAVPVATGKLTAACPNAPDSQACRSEVTELGRWQSGGLIDSRLLTAFQRVAPDAGHALDTDAQISKESGAELATLAKRIDDIYRASM
ncbi:hypothetical protein [Trinickia sp. Y13]|uniref:hypothetical protein n=1 Tax=Trinickia sp. Y13 TaxID=2917807 RepID=UPI0024049375|nr:hypothetical protein [Trinickia sp. Y13]MDG0024962.1 hypothetical protein [Trinickia sp. Y13]